MSFSGTKRYITKPKPGVMLNPLHPLSRGLVGYWLFNEGAGSRVNDISGKGNHGTLTNMSSNAQGSGWGGSKFGGGLEFNGVDNYVDCGNNANINGTGRLTASFWMRSNDISQMKEMIYLSDGNLYNDFFVIGMYDSKILASGDQHMDDSRISNTLNSNQLYHIVVVKVVGSITTIYVDAVNVTAASSVTFGASVAKSIIGGSWYTGAFTLGFDGPIGPVNFYNRTVSPVEVKMLHEQPFCNLLQVPTRRYSVAAPPVGAIMNQLQRANIGADLYNGVFA